jgi:hypothetical protein
MADLLDIAPSTAVEIVKVDGLRIKVERLHANAIASIAARFPSLATLFGSGNKIVPRLITEFGDAVGPIIAAGCGHLGDEKYEQRASMLSVEDQLQLVMAIYRLTFPNGLAALLETMANLVNRAGDEDKKIRLRLKKLPLQSQPSSDAASHRNMQ